MSRCNQQCWGQQPSGNGFPPQFLNIPGLTPYGTPGCSRCSSSPCCSAGFSPFCPQFQNPGMQMNRPPVSPMGRMGQTNGIRLRCPSCCRPMGSCTCGCCKCQSKTYY